MADNDKKKKLQDISRRDFLRLTGIAAAGTIIVSCGGTTAPAAQPTTAPAPAGDTPTEAPAAEAPTEAPAAEAPTEAPAAEAPTEAPAGGDAPTPTIEVPRGNPTEKPRDQSLVLMWGA